jgi:hypothetical protein
MWAAGGIEFPKKENFDGLYKWSCDFPKKENFDGLHKQRITKKGNLMDYISWSCDLLKKEILMAYISE